MKKGGHTKKTDEALGGLQEGERVDACIGDGLARIESSVDGRTRMVSR